MVKIQMYKVIGLSGKAVAAVGYYDITPEKAKEFIKSKTVPAGITRWIVVTADWDGKTVSEMKEHSAFDV